MIVVVLILAVLAVLTLYRILHGTFLWRLPRCTSTQTLHGKTAVVTGANTGIGKVTALELARRGARVILACRGQQRAEMAVQDIVTVQWLNSHYKTIQQLMGAELEKQGQNEEKEWMPKNSKSRRNAESTAAIAASSSWLTTAALLSTLV